MYGRVLIIQVSNFNYIFKKKKMLELSQLLSNMKFYIRINKMFINIVQFSQ